MAIVKKEILGTLSSKVGSLVYHNKNGKQIVRSLPRKSTKPPTDAQLAQRMRFGLASSFLSPLKSITSKGYGHNGGTASQSAQCVAYHSKYAIIGSYPHLEIDYSRVILTTGKLASVGGLAAVSEVPTTIQFSWNDQALSAIASTEDEAILVVYSTKEQRHEFLRTKYNRAAQYAEINIPFGYSGQSVHCWIIFISPDGKEFSTSKYVGAVSIA